MPSSLLERWAKAVKANSPHPPSGRASLIIPRLYLSDLTTATNEAELSALGVTHVVSLLEWTPDIPQAVPASKKLHIDLPDFPNADILAHLDDTTQFVKAALNENETNVVLAHCFMGVSRSATVVCAYLISTTGMTAMESIAFVQSKRHIVSPNNGFRKQLGLYAARVTGELNPGDEEAVEIVKGIGADT